MLDLGNASSFQHAQLPPVIGKVVHAGIACEDMARRDGGRGSARAGTRSRRCW